MLHAALHVRQKERSTNGRAFISAHPEHGWNTGQPTWQDLALISNNFALNSEVCEVRFVVGFGLPLLSVSISRRGAVSPRMYVKACVMLTDGSCGLSSKVCHKRRETTAAKLSCDSSEAFLACYSNVSTFRTRRAGRESSMDGVLFLSSLVFLPGWSALGVEPLAWQNVLEAECH